MSSIRPRNQKEAKIWNYYNSSKSWDWIPIRNWPTDIAQAVICDCLDYVTIFRLFMYLVGNGFDPENIPVVMGSMVHNRKDEDHIKHLLLSYKKGYMDRYSYWDENLQKTIKLGDQNSEVDSYNNKNYPDGVGGSWMPPTAASTPYGNSSSYSGGFGYNYNPSNLGVKDGINWDVYYDRLQDEEDERKYYAELRLKKMQEDAANQARAEAASHNARNAIRPAQNVRSQGWNDRIRRWKMRRGLGGAGDGNDVNPFL